VGAGLALRYNTLYLKGNLLEIMYNLVDEDANGVGIANIFHAMRCRKEMYKYLPRSI
jgi:hypothetical protein